ncbi:hypothetical protein [Plantibacter sp. RU18]|uniref:hypothetical protein n=1 Tax=Plantibacter sp. RU18 TaxID=3158143 RepID=UPI003D369164
MQRIDRHRRRPVATAVLAVAAIAAGLLLPGVVPAAAVVRTAVEPAECVVDVPGGARCGELTVPITRAVADSPIATLPYAIVPAALDTGRSPIVYLAGGVPLSDVDVRAISADRGLAADRDVIFVERRGGGDAKPSLGCPAAVEALADTLGAGAERAAALEAIGEAFGTCAATWQEEGFSANDFGATQSASDLRSLREQLGYARWTIMAVGTSANVALAAPAADPDGVDAIVLDGPDLGVPGIVSAGGLAAALASVDARRGAAGGWSPARDGAATAPGEEDHASRPVEAAAAASESGAAGTGAAVLDAAAHSAAVLADASATLDRHPRETDGARTLTIGPDALYLIVSGALSDATAQAALPFVLDSVAAGHSEALDALAAWSVNSIVEGEPVQDWVLGCSTAGWPGTTEPTDEAAPPSTTLLQDVAGTACTSLGVAPTPPPGPIGLPAFVVSAPEQDAAADGAATSILPRAISASFPGAGSVPTATSGCAVIAVRGWLTEPSAYRAALCAVDDAAVSVVQQADVAASPRWVQQGTDGTGGLWLLLALPLVFGIVALAWSIAWAYRLIAQALRHDPVQAGLRLGVAPVFGASWAIASAVTLLRSADYSPATHLLGVPAALPWLSIVLLVSCIGLVPVWQGAHRGSRLRIVALSVLWAATAAWTAVFVLAWW